MSEKQYNIGVQGKDGLYHDVTAEEAEVLGVSEILRQQNQAKPPSEDDVRRAGMLGRPSNLIPTTIQDPTMYRGGYGGNPYGQQPVIIQQYFGGQQPEQQYVGQPQQYEATRYSPHQPQPQQNLRQLRDPHEAVLALISGKPFSETHLDTQLVNPSETGSSVLDKLKAKPKVLIAGAVAVAALVGVGMMTKSSAETGSEKTASGATESSNEKGSNFELRPYEIPNIAKYDATITASTMWNFSANPFDSRYAVGTAPDDASWDFSTDPEFTISAKLPYDPASKNVALAELTPKDSKKRIIQVDMSKLIVDISVDPKTLDTTDINLFRLATRTEQDKILTGAKLSPQIFRDTYEKNKNDAESQSVGYAAAALLADPDHRSEILSRAKAKVRQTLELSDADKYELRFIGDDKFGAQQTVKDAKYVDLEKQFPQAAVANLVKELGYSGRQVRIINAPGRKPVVSAKLNEPKTA